MSTCALTCPPGSFYFPGLELTPKSVYVCAFDKLGGSLLLSPLLSAVGWSGCQIALIGQ